MVFVKVIHVCNIFPFINTYRAGLHDIQNFDFGLKNSNFQLPYQRPSSSAEKVLILVALCHNNECCAVSIKLSKDDMNFHK